MKKVFRKIDVKSCRRRGVNFDSTIALKGNSPMAVEAVMLVASLDSVRWVPE